MEEIHKLRAQISNIVRTNFPELDVGFVQSIKPPNELQVSQFNFELSIRIEAYCLQVKVVRQLLCASFIDQVAVRKDLVEHSFTSGTKYASSRGIAYRALGLDDDVYIHPSSVLFSRAPPDYVVFQEAVRSSRIWLKCMLALPLSASLILTSRQRVLS